MGWTVLIFLVLYLNTALFEMKIPLISLCNNSLDNLNFCEAIHCIIIFRSVNMLSFLNKDPVCAKYGEDVIMRVICFGILIHGSR